MWGGCACVCGGGGCDRVCVSLCVRVAIKFAVPSSAETVFNSNKNLARSFERNSTAGEKMVLLRISTIDDFVNVFSSKLVIYFPL